MSAANYEPEWIPVDATGRHWRFESYRGRHLGTVVVITSYWKGQTRNVYLAIRKCCQMEARFDSMWTAKTFVQKTLRCTECAVKVTKACLESDSN